MMGVGGGVASLPSRAACHPIRSAGSREGEAVDRVLIADDHPLVRDGLRAVISLAFEGCELFEAATLDEALSVLGEGAEFDLVLLDLNMPGASGFDGLDRMVAQFPATPVVVVSGSHTAALVRGALAHGAAGFVPKSLRRSAIAEALRAVLDGEVYVPADIAEEITTEDAAEASIRRRIDLLTPQQRVVFGLMVAGRLNKQIAYELDVSMTTVKAHVSAVLAKLEVFNRTQAVILANRVGFPPVIPTRK